MLKDMNFCHLQKNLVINMEKKLMDTAIKTGIHAAKTVSKEFNKTADKIASTGKSKKKDDKRKKVDN